MTSVTVVIPVLGRPHRVEPLLESLIGSQRIVPLWPLFVCTPGDDEEIAAVRDSGEDYAIVDFDATGPGQWARKVNVAVGATDADWVFAGADDLRFEAGWADEALAVAEETGARLIGTDDLGNPAVRRGGHATHFLATRSYVDELGTIDEPGKLLCAAYHHWWVDVECVETAKARGEWAFAKNSVVEHLHPYWKFADGTPKAETDWVYQRGESRHREDGLLFRRRRRLWGRANYARLRRHEQSTVRRHIPEPTE